MSGANLSDADLRGAYLRWSRGWTEEQLSEAMTLEDATMPGRQILQGDAVPDGPTLEEWLKDRERR